ncbi:MAG: hypothetical protein ACYDDO_15495, partial [Acidiferrobacterales bacterium]
LRSLIVSLIANPPGICLQGNFAYILDLRQRIGFAYIFNESIRGIDKQSENQHSGAPSRAS